MTLLLVMFKMSIRIDYLFKVIDKINQSLTQSGFLGPFNIAFYLANICLNVCGFWNFWKSSGHYKLNHNNLIILNIYTFY